MIREYDFVKIKGTDITGAVIDIHTVNGKTMCYIDSDKRGNEGEHGYVLDWDLFYCELSDLEVVESWTTSN